MNILGISAFYHESAAALVVDGRVIAAAAEERFTRKKHDSDFPEEAVDFCLNRMAFSIKDIDYVVFYEKPFLKFNRLLVSSLATVPSSYTQFREGMLNTLSSKLWVKSIIARELSISPSKVLFVPHHISHASSSYYFSPFEEAAVLTLDGVGEWTVGSWGTAKGNQLTIEQELRFPHSLGLLYSAFTAYLGFEVNDGEYKVMGMAPYGEPKYTNKVWQLVRMNEDGTFQLDLSFFEFHRSASRSYSKKFVDLFGPPRAIDSHFFTPTSGYPGYFGKKPRNFKKLAEENQKYADIAASIQKVTEDIILELVNSLQKKTKQENLVFAGGVALNSVANGRLQRETKFKNIFINPAAGDDGGAMGAALYVYHHILKKKKTLQSVSPYLGRAYTERDIEAFLKAKEIKFKFFPETKELAAWIAKELAKKKVIGLFQGAFEWGPRALGNRSIIADPRSEEMKDIVNTKIKFREPYRPFAPAVLSERASGYFDIKNIKDNYLAKYMLTVVPVKESAKKIIPAVTHVDGSARVQLVDKEMNPMFRMIVEEFEKKTGVPVLMNTSFNLKGEPIVTSPENAYNTFMASGLDHLVLENFVVSK